MEVEGRHAGDPPHECLRGRASNKGPLAEDEYDTCYAVAFRSSASEPPERKLEALLGHGTKLPGIEAPTASTIIHFIHPEFMPIIDVRTVEVLLEAGLISSKQRDLEHYEEFRAAIDNIRRDCRAKTLRQIDRALFAYHKIVLDKKRHGRKRQCQDITPLKLQ